MLLTTILLGALHLGLSPTPEPGPEPDPQAELGRRIDALVQEGNYAKALELLDVADSLQPNPDWLFMRGGILVLQGDCEAAVITYHEYFGRGASGQEAAAEARAQLRMCEEALGRQQDAAAPVPVPVPVGAHKTVGPAADRPSVPPQDVPRSRARWRPDPWATALVAVGAASLVGGVGFWLQAAKERTTADNASTLGGYARYIERAETFSNVGLGLTVTGSALVTGAIVRYVLVRVRARRSQGEREATPFRPVGPR